MAGLIRKNAHAPFLFEDVMVFCDGRTEFTGTFGASDYKYVPWKLSYMDSAGNVRQVETGLDPAAVECSPSVYRGDGALVIGFIGQVPAARGHLKAAYYECRGPSLAELSPAVKVLDAVRVAGHDGHTLRTEVPLERMLIERLNAVPGEPGHWIVTCMVGLTPCSIVMDGDRVVGEIKADGAGVYKCAILDGRLVYAKRGAGHEERDLYEAESWSIEPYVTPTWATKAAGLASAGAAAVVKPLRASEELRTQRLNACAHCDRLQPHQTCGQCGCYIPLKVTQLAWNCPLGRWPR